MTHDGSAPIQIDLKRTGEVAASPLANTFIVLFDENDDAREFLAALLGVQGALVVGAASEGEALDLVATGSADVLMIGAGALENEREWLIRRVRDRVPGHGGDVPAIALTEYWSPRARAEALAAGYQECLAWPFAAGDVVETARRLARK